MTIDALIKEYLIESGDESEHRYARILTIAIAGLREMHLDVSGAPKRLFLDINKRNNTVLLPDDFVTHKFIGFCGRGGNLISLGYNADICPPNMFDECGFSTGNQTLGGPTGDLFPINYEGGHIRNGELTGGFFGLGGGQNSYGYYKVDTEMGIIALQSLNLKGIDKLVLEYISDPSMIGSDTEIHPYDVEAIKSWVWFKDIQKRRTGVAIADKQMANKEWVKNKNLARRRHSSFTLDEALQSIRKSNKLSPKF